MVVGSTTCGMLGLDTVLDTALFDPEQAVLALRNANELTIQWLVPGELGEFPPSN